MLRNYSRGVSVVNTRLSSRYCLWNRSSSVVTDRRELESGSVHVCAGFSDMGGTKRKYYAVVKGKNPGVYDSWSCCEGQVKGFPGNQYKGFPTREDASDYLKEHGIVIDDVTRVDTGEEARIEIHDTKQKKRKKKPEEEEHVPHVVYQARLEFDGASKRNPGPAGFGAVIFDEETNMVVKEITGYLGDHGTNNQAEYAGLVAGLYACKELGVRDLKVKGDSKLVINQVLNKWQVKNEELQRYHRKAIDLIRSFGSFQAEHVLREFNTHADRLSNVAIEEKRPWNLDENT